MRKECMCIDHDLVIFEKGTYTVQISDPLLVCCSNADNNKKESNASDNSSDPSVRVCQYRGQYK